MTIIIKSPFECKPNIGDYLDYNWREYKLMFEVVKVLSHNEVEVKLISITHMMEYSRL